jgi:hypothetical protein
MNLQQLKFVAHTQTGKQAGQEALFMLLKEEQHRKNKDGNDIVVIDT